MHEHYNANNKYISHYLSKTDKSQILEIKITSQSLAVLKRDVYTYFKPAPFCSAHRIPIAFSWPGWVFKFYHTVYNRHYLKRKIQNGYQWYFVENTTDYVAYLKNAVHFLVVWI